MLDEAALTAALAAHGHRLTRPRRAVLRVVAEAGATLSPAEIHRRARRIHARTGLVTVYRTLEVLAACGVVQRVHQPDGCRSYAPASAGHAHHVICQNCQSVTEFDNCDLAGLLRAVQRRTGYQIDDHWLELFGLCPRCQQERQRGGQGHR